MKAEMKWDVDPIAYADKLTGGMKNTVIRKAMNKASATVKEAVISNAPERYGFLKKSIRIKLRNYQNKSIWVSVIGPKSDFKRGKGKAKRGATKGQTIYHRPALYVNFLEKGSSHAKAFPFLAPALAQSKSQFMDSLQSSIKEQTDAIIKAMK